MTSTPWRGAVLLLLPHLLPCDASPWPSPASWPTAPLHSCTSPSSYQGWADTKEQAEQMFYQQADWGYLDTIRRESVNLCSSSTTSPSTSTTSSTTTTSTLHCAPHLASCHATNFKIDFRKLSTRVRRESLRYSSTIFGPGDLRVSCGLQGEQLRAMADHLSPLQSWAPELLNLEEEEEEGGEECDEVVTTPTLLVKLDAQTNMYHHFCDFLNIYLTLQLNQSLGAPAERQVILLDNHPYYSSFGPAWAAFTSRPLMDLNTLAGRVVCFKDLLLPLLPRMVFGLYYSTPVIPGCSSSSLLASFSSHLLSSLHLPPPRPHSLLRLTLLSRATKYRRIVNEGEVVAALEATGRYRVTLAAFTAATPFPAQLEMVGDTDVLAGLHGAGLTHLLFLPPWGQLVELYDCEDQCYRELARARGVGYTTWEGEAPSRVASPHPSPHAGGPAHSKFADYRLEAAEVVRLVGLAADRVRGHRGYREAVEMEKREKWENQEDLGNRDHGDGDLDFDLRNVDLSINHEEL